MAQRILVINDHQEILELFRLPLEDDAGYKVTLFSLAPHELVEIARVQPDLVILDLVCAISSLSPGTIPAICIGCPG